VVNTSICLIDLGKREVGDETASKAALREAQEEIGINPEKIQVITELEPTYSRSGFLVYPVICALHVLRFASFTELVEENKLRPNAEVSEIFACPLRFFLEKQHHSTRLIEWMQQSYLVHEILYKRWLIWAMTANILIHVSSIAFARAPLFPFDYERFKRPPPKLLLQLKHHKL